MSGDARPQWGDQVLAGAAALVTGGASGIGLACAERLASAGARVVVADADGERVSELEAKNLRCVVSDVTSPKGARLAVTAARDVVGPLHVLVNNVGRSAPPNKVADIPIEDWDLDFTRNVRSTFLVTQAVLSADDTRELQSIVNIGASLAERASPHLAAYGAAKAAVAQLTRTLAVELGRQNVRVNCVAPGFTVTPASERFVDAERRAATEFAIPLGRVADAVEIADVVVFLASRFASFVSGQTIIVDGGLLSTTLRAPRGWEMPAR